MTVVKQPFILFFSTGKSSVDDKKISTGFFINRCWYYSEKKEAGQRLPVLQLFSAAPTDVNFLWMMVYKRKNLILYMRGF